MQNRIREIRQRKGISGTKIAKQIGISAQYFYDIEKGERNLSAELAVKIAEVLGVSVNYLLNEHTTDNYFNSYVREDLATFYDSSIDVRLKVLDLLKMLTDDEGNFFEDLRGEVFECINESLFFYFQREELSKRNYSYYDFKEYFTSRDELSDWQTKEAIEEFNSVFNYNTFKQVLNYLEEEDMLFLQQSLGEIAQKHGLNKRTPSTNDEKEFVSQLELSDKKILEQFDLKLDGKKLTKDEAKGVIAYLRSLRQFDK